MALRSVAGCPAATSWMRPWSNISIRSTRKDLVSHLEVLLEGRVLLWRTETDSGENLDVRLMNLCNYKRESIQLFSLGLEDYLGSPYMHIVFRRLLK